MRTGTKLEVGTKVVLDGKPGTVIARREQDSRFFLLVARPSGTEVWVPEGSERLERAPDPTPPSMIDELSNTYDRGGES